MISVEDAVRLLAEQLYKPGTEIVPLSESVGRYLAVDVCADRDFPPFDRVAMDGIAVRFDDFDASAPSFPLIGTRLAGQPMTLMGGGRIGVEVMTGAILPEDADTVVRYEDCILKDGSAIIRAEISKGQNIHRKGSDARAGDVVLKAGSRLTAADVPILASVGLADVNVHSLPSVAIVSTGDELVPVESNPLPHQIRSSNSHAIAAALREFGIICALYHLRDDQPDRQQLLNDILRENEIVILTGGVSKGKMDWVPDALSGAGITKVFHQVSQRPGKPFWFGKGDSVFVFAFPGNPVSTFLCLYRYLIPWLRQCLAGGVVDAAERNEAILSEDFTFKPELTLFLQVTVRTENGTLLARPVPGGGSGDFINLSKVDGFLELPAGAVHFKAGMAFPYFPFRR